MWSFRDISISYKTLVPPIIMMIALGSVVLITVHGFDKQDGVIRHVNEIALERSTLLNRFIMLSERVQSDLFLVSVMRFMGVPDEEVVPVHNQLEEGWSNLGFIYHQILNEWPLDATEKETLKQMKAPLDGFRKQARQATDMVFKNPSFGILLVRSATLPFAQFRKLLTKFLDYQRRKIVKAETVARQTAGNVKTTTLIISITMALISILLTALIGNRFISRPVRDITAMMGRLALGDLSVDIKEQGRGDEIGSMAAAVEVFRQNAVEKRAAEEELINSNKQLQLETAERRHAESRLEKEMTAVAAILNNILSGELDEPEIENRILDACLIATDSVYGMIGVINEHGKYDTTCYSSQTIQDCAFPEALAWDMSTGMTIRGIWGWPMLHGEPMLCNDLEAHPDRLDLPEGHVPIHCFLGVPLKREGDVVGMVAVANKPGGYTDADRDTLVRLASVMSVSRQHRVALIEARKTHAELEGLVRKRTDELQKTVNLMAGREVRMAELKEAIQKLRAQLEFAGLTPVADDPLKEMSEQ